MRNPGRPSDTATLTRAKPARPTSPQHAALRQQSRTSKGLGGYVAALMRAMGRSHPVPAADEYEERRNPSPVYEQVTAAILEAMDRDGMPPWRKPWRGAEGGPGLPYNGHSGRFYRGCNIALLWAAKEAAGFSSHEWWTVQQAMKSGGRVLPEQAGRFVIFIKPFLVDEESGEVTEAPDDESVPEGARRVAMLRTYTVFNRDQCEGLPPVRFAGPYLPDLTPDERAATLIIGNGHLPPIRHVAGDRAYYEPGAHRITMPKRQQFGETAEYYSTLYHECTHSTGKAMGRKFGDKHGDSAYAREELVAEMGAAFLCALAGIENTAARQNSVAYLKNWRDRIAADPRLIITAAAQASAACDYLRAGAPKWKDAEPAEAEDQRTNPPGYSTFPATANVSGKVLKGTFRRDKAGHFLPRDPAERDEVAALRVAQAWGITPGDVVGGRRLDSWDARTLAQMVRYVDPSEWAADRAARATAKAERQAARMTGQCPLIHPD